MGVGGFFCTRQMPVRQAPLPCLGTLPDDMLSIKKSLGSSWDMEPLRGMYMERFHRIFKTRAAVVAPHLGAFIRNNHDLAQGNHHAPAKSVLRPHHIRCIGRNQLHMKFSGDESGNLAIPTRQGLRRNPRLRRLQ